MTTAVLSKWGTGQGFHVTKAGMKKVGVSVGQVFSVVYEPGRIIFELPPQEHRPVRVRATSFDELFAGWDAPNDLTDPWGDNGAEFMGAESRVWGEGANARDI